MTNQTYTPPSCLEVTRPRPGGSGEVFLFLIAFTIILAYPVSADNAAVSGESGRFSLGAGLESAQHTLGGGMNFGGLALADYGFPIGRLSFAAGLRAAVAHNFAGMLSVEPAAFFRWYAP
jgi:hypothetical protein